MSSALTLDRPKDGRGLRVVFDETTIADRVIALAEEISLSYPQGELLVLGLLKGSVIFLSDLVRRIRRPLHLDFLVVSSYGDGMVSSGDIRLLYRPGVSLHGKHVLVVEDIIDSGRTVRHVLDIFAEQEPASLAVCALLNKELHANPIPELRWVGFPAPPAFLVGYGLDHAEDYRHLPFIGELN